MQAEKYRAVFVDDLIESGTTGVRLSGAQQLHVPLCARADVCDCYDWPNAFHLRTTIRLNGRAPDRRNNGATHILDCSIFRYDCLTE